MEGRSAADNFFRRLPRHRTLISSNKVHTGSTDPKLNLRMDWNSLLSDVPGLLFENYSERYGSRVSRIDRRADGIFLARTESGEVYEAKRVIVATGVSKPNIPDIPGIETAELYTEVSSCVMWA